MIARLLALTLWLVPACASAQSPEPRRPNHITDATDKRQDDRQQQQQPAAPVIAVKEANSTNNPDPNRPQVTAPDKQQASDQAVTVRSLPRVNIVRDWVDYTQIGLTLLLIVTTIGAGIVAWLAFRSERDAIRLTQRADVLPHTTTITHIHERPPGPPFYLDVDSRVHVAIKNFGPTRASNLQISLNYSIQDVAMKAGAAEKASKLKLPVMVLAALDQATPVMPYLGTLYEREPVVKIAKGEIPLKVIVELTYVDVFSKTHRSHSVMTYHPDSGGFNVEKAHDAD